MMYPGLVNESAKRSFDVGHIMNYGDGVYGGVFITAMHSAAYTAETIMDIVDAGLAVIPEGTLFKDVMNDVMESYNNGDTWEENWQKLEDKWAATDKCLELSGVLNIDAKLNSAYVLIGMLYGEGDIEKTIVISGRCGQDSDCNPSSAASILGNFYGASKMDDKYKSALDYTGRMFSHTSYNLNDVLELNFGLMKDVLTQNNVKYDDGTWTLTPAAAYEPVEFEQWPDGISAMLNVTPTGGKSVKISLQAFGSEKVKSVSYNMGDGFETNAQPVLYTYSEAGEYTVTCTVTGENGSEVTARSNISVEDSIPIDGHAVCSVTAPTGGGNKDVSVIYDGIVPSAIQATDKMHYDT